MRPPPNLRRLFGRLAGLLPARVDAMVGARLLGVALSLAAEVAHGASLPGRASESLSVHPVPLPATVKSAFLERKPAAHVMVDPGYRIWCMSVMRWVDRRLKGSACYMLALTSRYVPTNM